MHTLEDRRGKRVVDCRGNFPRKGAQTEYAVKTGCSLVFVRTALRDGRLVVNETGDVIDAADYRPPRPAPLTSLADICNAVLRFIHNTGPVDPAAAESACFAIVDTARRALNAVTERPTISKGDQS
ncbi:MAG TPA: hypothetical protein VKY24_03480 [Reyranella sp.]|nr:hypothetical protein [Reyranella sp.]